MNPEVSSPASIASVAFAIRNLALKSIEPSGTPVQERRRTHYDAAALKELAENIKAVQVIEPIIVRPKNVRNSRDVGPRFQRMSVQHFTACRPPISRHVGPRFHGMSVQSMR